MGDILFLFFLPFPFFFGALNFFHFWYLFKCNPSIYFSSISSFDASIFFKTFIAFSRDSFPRSSIPFPIIFANICIKTSSSNKNGLCEVFAILTFFFSFAFLSSPFGKSEDDLLLTIVFSFVFSSSLSEATGDGLSLSTEATEFDLFKSFGGPADGKFNSFPPFSFNALLCNSCDSVPYKINNEYAIHPALTFSCFSFSQIVCCNKKFIIR